jgi:hypothetical protein
MVNLPKEFADFTSHTCNRFEFLQKWMQMLDIPFKVVTIGTLHHIFVQFPQRFYTPLFRTKTVIVHFDRAPLASQSSSEEYNAGANDNSAAVYQVLLWVKRLLDATITRNLNEKQNVRLSQNVQYNIRVVFSDGEELAGKNAGSFGLAEYFIEHRLAGNGATQSLYNDIYVLDGCGRGEILAISTAGKFQKASSFFLHRFDSLYENCCNLSRISNPESWVTLPIPYGDNAGFIANGIPAIMLTVLPKDEATSYLRQLQIDKKFSKAVMNHEISMHGSGMRPESLEKLRSLGKDPAKSLLLSEKLPKTWRIMHTEFDTTSTLNEEAFMVIKRFLDALALSFIPV